MTPEEKAAALFGTLNSRGWVDVIAPMLELKRRSQVEQLIKGGSEVTDERLKGRIEIAEALLSSMRGAGLFHVRGRQGSVLEPVNRRISSCCARSRISAK